MDPITYALHHVQQVIPRPILQIAFGHNNIVQMGNRWNNTAQQHQSLEYSIRDKVIEGRVNLDANLVGGMQVGIDLIDVDMEQIDYGTRVYRIPFNKTEGRRIISCQTLHYSRFLAQGAGTHASSGNPLMRASKEVLDSVSAMPIVSTANLQLIGENVVMVRDNVDHLSPDMALICMVEHEEAMRDLNPGIYPLYAQMVEQAVKSYIYIHTVVPLDQGALYAGMQLGQIREVIQDYRDAEEEYQRIFREQWRKAAFTNDRPRMNHFISSMFGRQI